MSFRQIYPDQTFGEYTLTADKKKLDLQYIYNLLCTPSRYSTGLPPERFLRVNKLAFPGLSQIFQSLPLFGMCLSMMSIEGKGLVSR